MDDDLIQKARAVAEALLPNCDVLAVYAYGSRVSGTPRADSDLDVGYFLLGYRDGARLSLRDELALADRMTDRLGVDVDFRDLGGAPLEVRGRILEEGVRIYSGDFHERVELEADTYSRYHDYKKNRSSRSWRAFAFTASPLGAWDDAPTRPRLLGRRRRPCG